jgi:hypothetical protein
VKIPVGRISSEMDEVGSVKRMWAADAQRFVIGEEER